MVAPGDLRRNAPPYRGVSSPSQDELAGAERLRVASPALHAAEPQHRANELLVEPGLATLAGEMTAQMRDPRVADDVVGERDVQRRSAQIATPLRDLVLQDHRTAEHLSPTPKGTASTLRRMMENLLAVVVSYGGSTYLPALLSTLNRVNGCRVTLMENDFGVRHPWLPEGVRVHYEQGNVGYGTAVNLGVRRHLEHDPHPAWVLVVNSDIVLPDHTAEMLPTLLDETPASAHAVGFAIRTGNGRQGRGSSVLPTSRTNAFMVLRGEAAAISRWPGHRYPIGAFFAIRGEAFLRLGGFDPRYWMYYEETDLFYRLLRAGGRIAWADESWHVVHDGGGTTGQSPMMHRELGRSAATYFRHHRESLGKAWPSVHATQLLMLAARKSVTGRPTDAARALRILHGLVNGLTRPDWEPAHHSPWSAVPATSRTRIGKLSEPLDNHRHDNGEGAPVPTAEPSDSLAPGRG